MNKIFERMCERMDELMARALIKLEPMLLEYFGVESESGLLFYFWDEPTGDTLTRYYNSAPLTEGLEGVMASEMRKLVENPKCLSSLEVEDHDSNEFGAGIRMSYEHGPLAVIVGFPKIVCLLVLAELMYRLGYLQTKNLVKVTDSTSDHMTAALEDLGMGDDQFAVLRYKISSIIADATLVKQE